MAGVGVGRGGGRLEVFSTNPGYDEKKGGGTVWKWD